MAKLRHEISIHFMHQKADMSAQRMSVVNFWARRLSYRLPSPNIDAIRSSDLALPCRPCNADIRGETVVHLADNNVKIHHRQECLRENVVANLLPRFSQNCTTLPFQEMTESHMYSKSPKGLSVHARDIEGGDYVLFLWFYLMMSPYFLAFWSQCRANG